MIDEELHLDAAAGLQIRQVGDAGIGDDGVQGSLKRADRVRRRGDRFKICQVACHGNAGGVRLGASRAGIGKRPGETDHERTVGRKRVHGFESEPEVHPVTRSTAP